MREPYYSAPGVTIYHGLSEEIVPTLGLSFTALLGDPPYGINAKTRNLSAKRGRIHKAAYGAARDWPDIHGDDKPFDPRPWLFAPKTVLWGANNFTPHLPPSACWFAWDKLNGGTPSNSSDIELAWTNLPGPARLFSHLWRGAFRAGRENSSLQVRVHPFQKPVALMHWCIRQARLTPRDLILDPWTGSGSLVEAAREVGIPIVAIDCAEWCCELAAKRCLQAVIPVAEQGEPATQASLPTSRTP